MLVLSRKFRSSLLQRQVGKLTGHKTWLIQYSGIDCESVVTRLPLEKYKGQVRTTPGFRRAPACLSEKLVLDHVAYNEGLVVVLMITSMGGDVEVLTDQFRFLGNWPPTPPLSQHFALSEK